MIMTEASQRTNSELFKLQAILEYPTMLRTKQEEKNGFVLVVLRFWIDDDDEVE